MSEAILLERRGSIAWITFNRPEVGNALDLEMYSTLATLIVEVDRDRDLCSLVLTGAGGRAFSSGGDIRMFQLPDSTAAVLEYDHLFEAVLQALEACRVPTIAAVAGPATGGGAALALTCDFRIGSPSARFGFPIARTVGNCLSTPLLARLVSLLGFARVHDLILTARLVGSNEALSIGLLNEVTLVEESLVPRAEEWARVLGEQRAPLTLAATREALLRIRRRWLPEGDGNDLLLSCLQSWDFKEGVAAFLEGRSPRWSGE